MPQTTQELVYQTFADVAPRSAGDLPAALAEAARQVQALRLASVAQTDALSTNTDAVSANTSAQRSASGGTGRSVTSVASGLLGGVLGMMPLVSGILRLFGGGESSAPAPLAPFALPPRIAFESTTNYQPVSYAQEGLPRAAEASAAPAPAPQVTVQVQAMDSRSFLDHSEEIARAVREAMLHMDRLNDIVSEL